MCERDREKERLYICQEIERFVQTLASAKICLAPSLLLYTSLVSESDPSSGTPGMEPRLQLVSFWYQNETLTKHVGYCHGIGTNNSGNDVSLPAGSQSPHSLNCSAVRESQDILKYVLKVTQERQRVVPGIVSEESGEREGVRWEGEVGSHDMNPLHGGRGRFSLTAHGQQTAIVVHHLL